MKIETQTRDDQQVQITAEVESEELEKFKRRAARQISKQAKIPGFRPGKAPYDVVKRLYGEDTIRDQAVEMLVDELYPQVLKEADVEPSGPGQLQEIVSYDPPTFAFIVPLNPEVELPDYRAIRKEYEKPEISDEEVEATINSLRRNYGTAEPVERAAEKGDLVYIKVSARYVKPEEGEEEEFVKETPLSVVAGESSPETGDWPYEGFSEEMIGVSAGEEKSIPYTFPEDSAYESLRGRDVVFHVVVQSIKELKLPELDDEFAKTLGEFENVEQLRTAVREQMETNALQQYDEEYLGDLIEEIVEQSTVKYPPHALEHEVEHVLEHLEEDLARQQMDLETYFKTRETTREQFIEEEATPAAQRRLEQALVLEELARHEEIRLQNADLQQAVLQRLGELPKDWGERYKTKQAQQELLNALTMDTANQMMNQHLLERLKAIASGEQEKAEAEAAAQAEAAAAEAEAAAETETPKEGLEAADTGETVDQAQELVDETVAEGGVTEEPDFPTSAAADQQAEDETGAAETETAEEDKQEDESAG